MSEQRKVAITQIDDIWQIASTRWGDPGRRTPRPDPRFEKLRTHLNEIEKLFGLPTEQTVHPAVGMNHKKYGVAASDIPSGFPVRQEPARPQKPIPANRRRVAASNDDDDEFELVDSSNELPPFAPDAVEETSF